MKMVYVLVAAVAAGAVVGGARSFADSKPEAPLAESSAARTPVAREMPESAPDEAADEPAGEVVEGEVLEVIDVPNYSYLRLGAKGSEGTWAAVPSATLRPGDRARVVNAMKMTGFKSGALDRTFPEIWFGTLGGSGAPAGFAGPRAANAGAPRAGVEPAHGTGDGHHDPHAQASQASVDVGHVARAEGANGKTVAEVIAQRASLAGKKVRVRATVVKATPGVLGRTYLHVRDGSGDPAAGTHDLVATTEATPAVGETIVLEGMVAVDRDVGAGYQFPTIVEDCAVSR